MELELGVVCISNKIICAMGENRRFAREITDVIRRFQNKDWGDDLYPEIKVLIDLSVTTGNDRILAAYHTSYDKVLIETKKERSATEVKFSDEYGNGV